MDPDSISKMIMLVVLLCVSAFFSASETALMALSKIRIRDMIEEEIKGAELVGRLVENPRKLLGAILIGSTVVNIGASALATSLAIKFFGNTGVGIVTGVMTLLVLVFVEITPKSLAVASSEAVAIKVSGIIQAMIKLLNPIIIAISFLTTVIIKVFGGEIDSEQPFITEKALRTLVDVGQEEGVFEVEERKMIHNVFQFSDSQVKDVMVPRTDIAAIDVYSSYDDILEFFKKRQCSRMPVYKNTIDNIIGIMYVKDMFFFDKRKDQFDIENNIRKPYYTFENKRIAELFEEMREKSLQMAVVADEYGGTAGIITMQDLVEEIFGDIGDEYDEAADEIQSIGEGEYIADGLTRLSLINKTLGTDLESEHYETIGGFVTGVIGRFPKKGEIVEFDGLKCIMLDVYRTRIKRVRLKVNKEKRQGDV